MAVTVNLNLITDDVLEGSNLYFTTSRVLATALTGFALTAGTISSADTVLSAFGKTQNQINTINTSLSTKLTGANNGLYVSGTTVRLGGNPLIENTSISGAFDLSLSTSTGSWSTTGTLQFSPSGELILRDYRVDTNRNIIVSDYTNEAGAFFNIILDTTAPLYPTTASSFNVFLNRGEFSANTYAGVEGCFISGGEYTVVDRLRDSILVGSTATINNTSHLMYVGTRLTTNGSNNFIGGVGDRFTFANNTLSFGVGDTLSWRDGHNYGFAFGSSISEIAEHTFNLGSGYTTPNSNCLNMGIGSVSHSISYNGASASFLNFGNGDLNVTGGTLQFVGNTAITFFTNNLGNIEFYADQELVFATTNGAISFSAGTDLGFSGNTISSTASVQYDWSVGSSFMIALPTSTLIQATTLNFNTNATATSTNIGNVTGASSTFINVGTGGFRIVGVASSTYLIGAATTTGTFTIGGTAQTGTASLFTGTGAMTINLGTGATGVKTISIGGTAANVIAIANTQTGGSLSLCNAMTTGTFSLCTTGVMTGTANMFTNTGAQAINFATGAGIKTLAIGGSAANLITIANTQTAGSVGMCNAMTTGTFTIGNGAMTGLVSLFTGSGVQTINYATGNAVKTIHIADHDTPVNVIKIGGLASTIGFLGATAVGKQVSGANLTNNVTAGGTDNTIDNYTDMLIYANDAAAIRNAIYQLSRKLKQVNDAVRLYGLLT